MRGMEGEQVLLRLILSESRTHDRGPLYRKIVDVLRAEGMAGATAYLVSRTWQGASRTMLCAVLPMIRPKMPLCP